jgi:hypothetical protein
MQEFIIRSIIIGAGATALLDIWNLILNKVFNVPLPNWAMVGRWFSHTTKGKFAHESIGKAQAVHKELAIGWIAHYVVGILFAASVMIIWGLEWALAPTLLPALIIGLVTVGCGWFILQPGMGLGVAAAKMPNATNIRLRGVLGHIIFGLGLYGTALLIAPN